MEFYSRCLIGNSIRTWLVRLGMVGKDFKETRALLTKNLEGNSAWKNPRMDMLQEEMNATEVTLDGLSTVSNTEIIEAPIELEQATNAVDVSIGEELSPFISNNEIEMDEPEQDMGMNMI